MTQSRNENDHFDLDHFDRHNENICKFLAPTFVDRNVSVVSL